MNATITIDLIPMPPDRRATQGSPEQSRDVPGTTGPG